MFRCQVRAASEFEGEGAALRLSPQIRGMPTPGDPAGGSHADVLRAFPPARNCSGCFIQSQALSPVRSLVGESAPQNSEPSGPSKGTKAGAVVPFELTSQQGRDMRTWPPPVAVQWSLVCSTGRPGAGLAGGKMWGVRPGNGRRWLRLWGARGNAEGGRVRAEGSPAHLCQCQRRI